MIANALMRNRFGDDVSRYPVATSIPPLLASTIQSGWMVDDQGACLLVAQSDRYHGSRSALGDLTGREAAVNGIAVYVEEECETGDPLRDLLGCAIAFATGALSAAAGVFEEAVRAVISISEPIVEDDLPATGRVTFYCERASEPDLVGDIERFQDELLLVIEYNDVTGAK